MKKNDIKNLFNIITFAVADEAPLCKVPLYIFKLTHDIPIINRIDRSNRRINELIKVFRLFHNRCNTYDIFMRLYGNSLNRSATMGLTEVAYFSRKTYD